MYKFEEICELIKIVGSAGVARVEIEHAGSKVCIEGQTMTTVAVPAAAMAGAAAPVAVAGSAPSAPDAAAPGDENLIIVPSPIVGTFYRSPNPDADPYVKMGDYVENGQVLCIVEAMKLMNEIECEGSGKIVKIYPENAEPVEYGQPLFALSTD